MLAEPGAADAEMLASRDANGQRVPVERRVIVEGGDLTDAQPGLRPAHQRADRQLPLQPARRPALRPGHAENVGRPLAIVLDNEVISAPRILQPITGGSGQISGNFTVEQANNLAVLLRSGALPAKLTIVEERTVGPGLGRDSIEAGKLATYVAAVLVVMFMFATYGLFGLFANIALLVQSGLIFGLMSVLEATLTLPGIAGIVLTIGTAVDSNVLIYERIREEAHAGRSIVSAIQAGFDRAFATIIDSNSTMAIAALILFFLGSGPGARLRGRVHPRHPDHGDHRRDPDPHDDRALVPLGPAQDPAFLRSSSHAPPPPLARRHAVRLHALPAHQLPAVGAPVRRHGRRCS